jgi:hypothetical protein
MLKVLVPLDILKLRMIYQNIQKRVLLIRLERERHLALDFQLLVVKMVQLTLREIQGNLEFSFHQLETFNKTIFLRGFAVKMYTEDGIWDIVGNNTPIFFIRDPILVNKSFKSSLYKFTIII